MVRLLATTIFGLGMFAGAAVVFLFSNPSTGGYMRTLSLIAAALVALFFCGLALADAEARKGNDWVRITARPCSDQKVLQHIPNEKERLDYRAATAHFQGSDYAACWRPHPGGIWLRYEDGDEGFVQEKDLRPVPEA